VGGQKPSRQGVEPDVDHVPLVPGNGDAPGDAGAADAQVLQEAALAAGGHELLHLVQPEIRLDELRVLLVELDQPVLVGLEPEEIALLLQLHQLVGQPLGLHLLGLGLGDVGLVADRVEPLVGVLVDVAGALQLEEALLDHRLVLGVGGAHEVVVGDLHALPEPLEIGHDFVGQGLGGHAPGGGGLLDLLAVLVGAGEEVDLLAHHPPVPGDHVRQHRGVGVPDVGLVVHIVDGGGDVEALGHENSAADGELAARERPAAFRGEGLASLQ
jgi:hypothetical protein